MKAQTLTAERLREVVDYDQATGIFTRRVRTSSNAMPGSVAGCHRRKRRCVEFRVDGVLYKAHRLAWFHVTGHWPTQEIDHIDGNPFDNRFANLRDVPRQTNAQNLKRATVCNRSTGVLGVGVFRNKFRAQISIDGVNHNLGHFDSIAAASAAYVAAKRTHHEGNTL
jgi:hypothetical protein